MPPIQSDPIQSDPIRYDMIICNLCHSIAACQDTVSQLIVFYRPSTPQSHTGSRSDAEVWMEEQQQPKKKSAKVHSNSH